MIHRQRWYGGVVALGVAAACVVGFAVAQELDDEDSLIVSEEILLEDAVNGALDGEADALPEDDALDLDDLLAEDDLFEDAEDELLEMDIDAAELPMPVVEPIVDVAEPPPPDVEPIVDVADAPVADLDVGNDLDLLVEGAIEEPIRIRSPASSKALIPPLEYPRGW